ncbi:MAG: DUF2656 domain-containing protein [Aulosira sp. ZfuVER01]|nr:DUF2656 domain-containing protein [Aulosira sp. ZfuVER01]MDZ8002260.1 DUF2656 domain-containing protein [Aulosira sp. DedVER01a]MDZ8052736.1 DUF2656 domain-containing protein [Aulosira sp. ZfuCHP01]
MFDRSLGRMLLSHNFDVSPDTIPALSREEFAEVFQSGLSAYEHLQCRLVNHPHWTVEILFPTNKFSPQQVGELCAQALAQKRRSQQLSADSHSEILVLGGIKTTPPTSDSPDALQPGNWGVDVVETRSGEAFLQAIAWDATIAQKPADSVFKVELKET